MGSRRKAREYALQVLYQRDVAGDAPSGTLNDYWRQQEEPVEETVRAFCGKLVEGVHEHRGDIDEMIGKYSTNWKLTRMAAVDKNILRLAIFELLFCPDIPAKVTLNEAVEIAKRYGTAESGAFVNGILDNVARDRVQDKLEETSDGN